MFCFPKSNCGLLARKHKVKILLLTVKISMHKWQALLLPRTNNDRQLQQKKKTRLFL